MKKPWSGPFKKKGGLMNNKTILVTGGAGYIGSHMVRALLEKGHPVVVLDDLSTGHRDLLPGGEFIRGNVGDPVALERIFTQWPVSAVMHFAAYSIVSQSVSDPLTYYQNNVANTITLLKAMIRHGCLKFIYSSSAAVYGEPETVPIPEDHPLKPTNPYGATKTAVERILADCDGAFGLKSVSLRYFNAAGAHDSAEIGERHVPETHLIPLVLQAAAGYLPHVRVFGTDYPTFDGTCIRDYVHVWDLARAHLLALDHLFVENESRVFNLGSSRGFSVKEVIAAAQKVTAKTFPVKKEGRRAGDPAVLVASSEKIGRELGWRPQYDSMEAIIQSAWQWHVKNPPVVKQCAG